MITSITDFSTRPDISALVAEFSPAVIHLVDDEMEVESLSIRLQLALHGVAWDAPTETLWAVCRTATIAEDEIVCRLCDGAPVALTAGCPHPRGEWYAEIWAARKSQHSLARQAQALTKACYYDTLAGREPERTTHGCGYVGGESCSYCDDFPGTEWEAESAVLYARRDKALRRVGDMAAVLAALQSDPVVRAAASRTVRLLGADAVNVHAFGEGWQALPQLAVFAGSNHGREK